MLIHRSLHRLLKLLNTEELRDYARDLINKITKGKYMFIKGEDGREYELIAEPNGRLKVRPIGSDQGLADKRKALEDLCKKKLLEEKHNSQVAAQRQAALPQSAGIVPPDANLQLRTLAQQTFHSDPDTAAKLGALVNFLNACGYPDLTAETEGFTKRRVRAMARNYRTGEYFCYDFRSPEELVKRNFRNSRVLLGVFDIRGDYHAAPKVGLPGEYGPALVPPTPVAESPEWADDEDFNE